VKILRVKYFGQWSGAWFIDGRLACVLAERLNWMKGLKWPEIEEILRATRSQFRWIDLDTDVKRAQPATPNL
jgi:hypothetical protein